MTNDEIRMTNETEGLREKDQCGSGAVLEGQKGPKGLGERQF